MWKRNVIIERKRLLIEAARLYYLEDLTQAEVGRRLHTTRSNVSKLLKAARELGLVEIKVVGVPSSTSETEVRLKEKFGLQDIRIVPSEVTYEDTLVSVGRQAARYLESLLHPDIRIALSWGTSLYHMVDSLHDTTVSNASVVQLHGGLGSRNLSIDGYELARRLARKIHAKTHLIQAPLVVGSTELRQLLMREPEIANSLSFAETVDVALLGIGTSDPKYSALVRAGLVSEKSSTDLRDQGAVAMVCGYYVDEWGRVLDLPVNDRVISLELDRVRKLPLRVGVALGRRKVAALLAALRGGYLNVVITDETAASGILAAVSR